MKKIIAVFTILCTAKLSMAQSVAISNSSTAQPAASAMLDVQSTNKGLLTPRMTTAQRTAILLPAKGLMVFDTDTNTFWFYNGTAWTNIASDHSSAYWSLTGNSGTGAGNFLGTTNAAPLTLKTNSAARVTVDKDGNVGIGNTTPAALFDVKGTSGTAGAKINLNTDSDVNVSGLVVAANNNGLGGAYGGDFTATGSSNIFSSGTAVGVSGYAQNSYSNYGFRGSSLTKTGQTGYGIYATSSGSGKTYGGYFKGDYNGVLAESNTFGGVFQGGVDGIDATGGTYGGYFMSKDIGLYAQAPYGLKLDVERSGVEISLGTKENTYDYPQMGVSVGCFNSANTENMIGVNTYVKAYNATGFAIGVYSRLEGGDAASMRYSVYGDGDFGTTGHYYSTSDAKLKQDIKPISGIMDKIMLLKPSAYQYRTKEYSDMNLPKGNQFGVIAQDVQQVFPELVANQIRPASYNDKKEKVADEVKYLGVNYDGFIPILIAGIQDLQKENEALKTELSTIKQKLHL